MADIRSYGSSSGGGGGSGVLLRYTVTALGNVSPAQRTVLENDYTSGILALVRNSTNDTYWNYAPGTGGVFAFSQYTSVLQGMTGSAGTAGDRGWNPVLANVTSGERIVQQIVDWVGGTGIRPATGEYIGATGLVADIANATNVRGAQGAVGAAGADGAAGAAGSAGAAGDQGWSPVLGNVVSGERVVQQVMNWIGGTGTAPATGQFLGTGGFVTDITTATDIRGAMGAAGTGMGGGGADGNNGWSPMISNVVDGERVVQRVVAWTGGSGTAPAIGQYIGGNRACDRHSVGYRYPRIYGRYGRARRAAGAAGDSNLPTLPTADGMVYHLEVDADGNIAWVPFTAGGGGTPAPDTHTIQYGLANAAGTFFGTPLQVTDSEPIDIVMPAATAANQRAGIRPPTGETLRIFNTGIGKSRM